MTTIAPDAPRLDLAAAAHPSGVHLRPYQEDAVTAILQAPAGGNRRPLIEVATGGGKTVIFAEAARRMGGRTVIIAHRGELLDQAIDKLQDVWPGVDVGRVQAGTDQADRQVVVASVQTLLNERRVDGILRHGAPGLVVVDEAHHAGAISYVKALRRLGCFTEDGPVTLGVTATPPTKDRHLARVFPRIVYRKGIGELIDEGYLVDPVGLQVKLRIDLNQVRTGSGGDYQTGALGDALTEVDAPGAAIGAYQQAAEGRKAVMFVPTVALAMATAERFREAGVPAEWISGEWGREDRAHLYRRLRTGETRVVVNAMLLTEGFDEPSVDCVIVARPTKSATLYRQMVGRGLRLYPGKTDCLVIDLVGAARENSLHGIGNMMDVPPGVIDGRTSLRKAAREQRAREAAEVARREAHEVLVERIDVAARFAWVNFPWRNPRQEDAPERTVFALNLGDRRGYLCMVPREVDDGHGGTREVWRVGVVTRDGAVTRLADDLSMEYAQGVAEDHARRVGADRINGKQAQWRAMHHSSRPGAVGTARNVGVRVERDWTAGQVADALTSRFARWALDAAARRG